MKIVIDRERWRWLLERAHDGNLLHCVTRAGSSPSFHSYSKQFASRSFVPLEAGQDEQQSPRQVRGYAA
jgi:hypothetical protein